MSSTAADGISIALARPRGARVMASLLALVVVLVWTVILGVIAAAGVDGVRESDALLPLVIVLAVWVALALIAWRYVAVAFGPRARLVVEVDGMQIDAPTLLRESPGWRRGAVRHVAIDEGSRASGSGRFPVRATAEWVKPVSEDDLAAGYLFTRFDGAVFPVLAPRSGIPNLAIVFDAPQAPSRLRPMARLVARRRSSPRLDRPAQGLLLEVADVAAARTALAGLLSTGPLLVHQLGLPVERPARRERPASEPPALPMALTLILGACLLPLLLGACLVGAAVLEWRSGHVSVIGIAAALLGLFILIAMIPRPAPAPAGAEMTPERQPDLFRLIDEVATALGREPFDEVVADLRPNAAALVVGLRRRRRILILGLPFAAMLSHDELKAVIAHEMAHLHGPEERFNRMSLRALDGLERTVRGLEDDWFTALPARLLRRYADLVERLVPALLREREFDADAASVSAAGAGATAGALQAAACIDAAFPRYWQSDVVPVLRADRRPPIVDGLRRYLGRPVVQDELASVLQRTAAERTDASRSHPSLGDRLAALGPIGRDSERPRGAAIRDDDDLERTLLAAITDPDRATALRRIAWSQVGEDVALPLIRRTTERVSAPLVSTPVGALSDPWGVARRLRFERGSGADASAIQTLGSALCVALADAGWTAAAEPGDELTMTRGELVVRPFVEVTALIEGRPGAPEHWNGRSLALGIAQLPLGSTSKDRSGSQAPGGG